MQNTYEIIDMGMDAVGIARDNNKVVFIPQALTGETVQATIQKDNKNFCNAKLDLVVSPSPNRVEPKCPYYKSCGGCNLQHTTYLNSLEYKTTYIKNLFNKAKLDCIVCPTVASNKEFNYRNKAVFNIANVNDKTIVGMYSESSHQTVQIEQCMLDDGFSKNLLCATREFISTYNLSGFDKRLNKGLLKNIMIRKLDDKYLIVLVATRKFNQINLFEKILSKYFKNFGLYLNVNTQNSSLIFGKTFEHICGIKNIKATFTTLSNNKIEYVISPESFMQVNDFVKDKIYYEVSKICAESDCVVDAYSGAGLLSAIIADNSQQVYGLEIVKSATQDAENLKKLNNIKNLTNINADCSVELPKLLKKLHNPQFYLVVDPPRKGVDQTVVDAILQTLPKKVVYISCNPATLTRDIKNICITNQYKISLVQPYDMFPQTAHIETLVVLEKI